MCVGRLTVKLSCVLTEISHHWIAAIVAILVLVVMALGFLCRKILKKKLAGIFKKLHRYV